MIVINISSLFPTIFYLEVSNDFHEFFINFSLKVINERIVEQIGLAYKNLKCGEAEFKVHPGRE